jgi:putative tryptophan/tyrosine transport system substrate-binding protein
MRRRDFIKGIVGSATAYPLSTHAQRPALPVVGFLSGGQSESWTPSSPLGAAFRGGLAEAGFVEGKNFTFEYRWAGGQFDRLPSLAIDLVNRGPAVIVTNTLPAALAAKAATSAIPVVFVVSEDPIKVGLVTSLNRPSANLTGVTNFMNVLGAKRMELASELVPQADGLALLVNQNNPSAEVDAADLRAAADALGKRMVVLKASSDAEIEAAFIAASEHKLGALFVNIDPFLFSHRELLALMAARYRLPTIYPLQDFVSAGGLMSYGANFANAWRQSGVYAGKILRGAKPADLPVLQPTKIELVINLNTAKALGLNIPAKLLALADEVIE